MFKKREMIFTLLLSSSVLLVLFSVNIASADMIIPEWIKKNAGWWSQGIITDSDYIKATQYLITQGVIQLPIKQVTATDTGLSQDSMAKSFVAHFKSGNQGSFDIYTISKITMSQPPSTTNQPVNPPVQFQLESIPSKDKSKYNNLVAYYVNTKDYNKDLVDVSIDVVAEDGTTIETMQFTKCQVSTYNIYVNDNKMQYRYGPNDTIELRDNANFVCQDMNVLVPQPQTTTKSDTSTPFTIK